MSTACRVIRVSRGCRCEFEIFMVRGKIADGGRIVNTSVILPPVSWSLPTGEAVNPEPKHEEKERLKRKGKCFGVTAHMVLKLIPAT